MGITVEQETKYPEEGVIRFRNAIAFTGIYLLRKEWKREEIIYNQRNYRIPSEWSRGQESLTVKFIAHKCCKVAKVYGIRIVKRL